MYDRLCVALRCCLSNRALSLLSRVYVWGLLATCQAVVDGCCCIARPEEVRQHSANQLLGVLCRSLLLWQERFQRELQTKQKHTGPAYMMRMSSKDGRLDSLLLFCFQLYTMCLDDSCHRVKQSTEGIGYANTAS